MGFLNTIILVGLLGIAVPVLIHLFARQKLKEIRFSSLAFLKRVHQQKIRRMKFRQILLLILRSLVICFIVLAFARPTCKQGSTLGGNAGSSVALVLDNSMSMGRKEMMKEAAGRAKQVLDLMVSGDEIGLVRTTDPVGKTMHFSVDRNRVRSDLDAVKLSEKRGNLAGILSGAARDLVASGEPNQEIVVISDLQASGFESETESPPTYDSKVNLFFIPLEGETHNLAIIEGGLDRQILQPGAPLQCYAVVKHFGSRQTEESLVRVFLSNKPVAQKMVTLEPGEAQRITFRIRPEHSGWIEGAIQLEDDVLTMDNRVFFTAWIPRQIRVRIAGTSPEELDWVRLALDPTARGSLFQLESFRYGQRRLTELEDLDVLFLVNYPRFDPDEADRLRRFIDGGGGLVILFGDEVDLRNYNDILLSPVLGFSTGHVVGGKDPQTGFMTLGPVDQGHPLFEGVFEAGNTAFRSPRIRRTVEFVGSDFLTVLRLSDGSPFLIEKKRGEGGVFLLSTGLKASWSDIPFASIFAPLIFRSAVYLSAPRSGEEERHIVGNPVRFETSAGDIDAEYTVVNPSNERIIIVPDIKGERMILTCPDPAESGIYRFERDGRLIALRAVNIDPRESDLTVLDIPTLKDRFPESKVFYVENIPALERSIKRSRWGRELWREMILIALLILIAETVVARETRRSSWAETGT